MKLKKHISILTRPPVLVAMDTYINIYIYITVESICVVHIMTLKLISIRW